MTIQKSGDELFKLIVSHSKEYGFIFPSSEIYDGLNASYDYGPFGAQLKFNIRDYWWRAMTQLQDDIVGIDAAIFMHPKVWKASGHVDAFNDPMIDNRDSKKRYRADNLIEDFLQSIQNKIAKEVEKGKKKFGETFNEEQFLATNPNVLRSAEKFNTINTRYLQALAANDLNELRNIIIDCEIADPESGSRNWTDVRQFNLMFSMQFGALAADAENSQVYLRPETAQGIFVNFLNVQKTTRKKLPFGIAQVGKAFRNEIVARQFIFRMREFEQMEMQFFVKPGTEMEWYNYWKQTRMRWHQALHPENKLRFHDHDKLAHYANAAVDIEFEFPFGFKELEGIHSRTDFDLSEHQKLSGRKLQYFDHELNENYVPYVVETSVGLDRMFLATLSNAIAEEEVPDAEGGVATRTVLKLPPALAPVKLAVLPLLNQKGLPEKGEEIFKKLRLHFDCQFEAKDTIGRRYRRQDAIGTPWCVTVDFETLENDTVTLRNRDSLEQIRIPIAEIQARVNETVSVTKLLEK
ncbi:MAG: glycine--tRNA ligase [Sphingobacteriales bacterium]|jgi:glycyl-tRNA synthetase|nr:glycine--tRNA ligase [Sphingobacteriales bacterium]MBP9141675.1 glycine--tRNA ligase [Chitinophagales bacterium]MDA0197471.1 glycine--tRNA ligase [Bacteroidota bacterium]MBK6890341.1 glycine--tRNA ligase [Sphingobacteriales bacterium]MBK7526606.1 glycine--tRNA ligase [Sphingobacteriales bacterium]